LLSAAVQGCEELNSTIEELLDITRVEAGKLRLNLAPVDLGVVLASARRGLQQRFEDEGVAVQVHVETSPALVLGDAARLASVFANLLTNALKYSPRPGMVTVHVASAQKAEKSAPQAVQISVTDRGPGIPAEYRERVFEKFFRVEHHSVPPGSGVRGTGIGLYLCREIVKAHGGTIWCEPGDGGLGARVVVELPRR
jgi:NtrC-family two-component system sensor histidine kinase KinB